MTDARIYQEGKHAMQSGRGRAKRWVLEHEPAEARRADPLTGWAGSGDVKGQIRLTFDTLEAAKGYAERQGLTARVVPAAERTLKLQSYADNFK